ncbi:MAG TPA: ATP-binding cassette domain-containing protein [Clostridia bacterium]|nr:ATP-binding cassette domain-containing protein [Clostridia bacterium]
MSIIEVQNLKKSFKTKVKKSGLKSSLLSLVSPQYRDIEAVKGIDFNVCKGEVLAFIGPNGAGKSTTIKILTGILHPTSGSVKVLGLDPQRDRKKLAYKIGNVFGQKSQLWFHLPPMDSLKLLGSIYEVPQRELEKRISQLVELFEIKDLIDVPVRKLSLGQRIRCEIAASLLHKPEVLFLDEPTIGLDIIAKQKIRDLIIRLNQEENTTIFLTSHDVGDIEQLCSRTVIINNGQVVLDDSVNHLKSNYLSKKIIEIKYTERVEPQVTGYEKQSEYKGRIEVSTESQSLHEVMAQLMNAGSIADITVSNQPLEEIIATIYAKTQGRQTVSYQSKSDSSVKMAKEI